MIAPLLATFFTILLFSVIATFTLISAINREQHDHSRPAHEIESPAEAQPTPPAKTISSAAPPATAETITAASPTISWTEHLQASLQKTRTAMLDNLSTLLRGATQIDAALLDSMHETLYRADTGHKVAELLVNACRQQLRDKEASFEQVQRVLQDEATRLLSVPTEEKNTDKKQAVLVVGVNGVGKTTTVGKLAQHYLDDKQKVLLCAADTFRDAAIDQLQIWAERLGVELIKHQQGADPGAVVFDAMQAARSRDTDVLLIDTAGRLHNKDNLMAELQKIKKIASKNSDLFALKTWIVLDATTGQNALQQVKAFLELVQISGIIVTKLDGTAKGGVLLGICEQFKIPVRFIGIGEKATDLRPFDAKEVAASIFG